ncbi:NADP-dependent oxidoreductase [Parahaliea maris]|uniref:NADP-dependent oxidoreductase n=1 Tax=Parahaliea maris TaxID=2716870 RepID=A0A5C9A689_9GAMM|nr:NADP-dependent oxidoreductase [Parahaliea maris]TXS96453.1 NADP-dependent oxidoreductase [Parahaliea maris]
MTGTWKNRAIVLARRPVGTPQCGDFRLDKLALPKPEKNQFVVRVLYCSLDPAMRRWMDYRSYSVQLTIDKPIACLVVGEVMESRCEGFPTGQYVCGMGAVADYVVMEPGVFTRRIEIQDDIPPTAYLNALGPIGLTAYNGLIHVGKPNKGDTVLISGAAGAVGSIAGQIAKIRGCRVVGIAGGSDKCDLLLNFFGFDGAIDYRGKDADELAAAISKVCPEGVDVFFDNVGGDALDATLANINQHARLIECGMIAQYNSVELPPGPRNMWQVIAKTATIHGFLNRYYSDFFEEAYTNLERWFLHGQIRAREHIDEGIENFHQSFTRLFEGSNHGKLILKI